MHTNLATKVGIALVSAAAGATMFASVALAAPVLPAGTTVPAHGARGTCTNCHTFAPPVVVAPPVVTPPAPPAPPVVTPPTPPAPPVVTPPTPPAPPVVTPPAPPAPPVVTPGSSDDHEKSDVAKDGKKDQKKHAKKHAAKTSSKHNKKD